MKFLHLSDLHLGKRVNDVSMIEDQKYILGQILQVVDDERPDAVLIAGDVYDKSAPSAEAVELLDGFLCAMAARGPALFISSGNHDSPERLSYGGRLMAHAGIRISPVYDGQLQAHTLTDEHGALRVYMLPFVKPVHVRAFFPDAQVQSYTDAVRTALSVIPEEPGVRRVLLTHQFVTGASRSDSEEISVGGSDNVDASVFDGFDYVALGHIHGPQDIVPGRVRYCGTPLKYSFSEARHTKSVTVVEMGAKGDVSVRTVPLKPMHDLREIRGSYSELTARDAYTGTATDDYLHFILTDEEDIPEVVGRLQVIYPNLMKLSYDNARTRKSEIVGSAQDVRLKSPLELFGELYENQNNQPMSDVQTRYMQELIETIQEATP